MTAPQGTTLANPVTLQGVGLFTAAPCACTLNPDPAGSGIRFALNNEHITAAIGNLSGQPAHPVFAHIPARCTAIGSGETTVWTIEHIMAALCAMRIDHCTVELSAPEVPIMDGSALPFVEAIERAGTHTLGAPIEPVTVREPIRVEQDGSFIEINPSETPSYSYTIDYGAGSPIARATVDWNADPEDFAQRIAPARTFCLEHEAQAMHSAGLFTHLSADDMLVIGERGPIGAPLRDPSECALHKLLDLIGDLALAGSPLCASVRAHKSGHALAHKAARAIADQQT